MRLSDSAMVELLTVHQDFIGVIARRFNTNYHAVEDIVQSTNLKIWVNRHSYNSDLPFKPWVVTICHQCSVAQFAKWQWRRQEFVSKDAILVAPETMALQAFTEKMVEYSDGCPAIDRLNECLNKLTQDERSLLLDFYGLEIEPYILAERYGRTRSAIYIVINKAKHKLDRMMRYGKEEI